jgi:hypothetical protein
VERGDPSLEPTPPQQPGRVGGRVSELPIRSKVVEPVHPPTEQSSRARGVIIVEAVVGPNGKVQDTKVLRSVPQPARVGGRLDGRSRGGRIAGKLRPSPDPWSFGDASFRRGRRISFSIPKFRQVKHIGDDGCQRGLRHASYSLAASGGKNSQLATIPLREKIASPTAPNSARSFRRSSALRAIRSLTCRRLDSQPIEA